MQNTVVSTENEVQRTVKSAGRLGALRTSQKNRNLGWGCWCVAGETNETITDFKKKNSQKPKPKRE